ncbi:MAG: LysR family transcriptional regulator [Fusobacteriaceae bacterium]|jgi:DNA-binding transcriptional LysR family regulator|nr:LysR family transcriptional regulator [Fusobacteriaceae bacterium]
MDTRYLHYILTIARKKNITRASEELYVSQSSLSQLLAKLEDEIGMKLFFRDKGEVTLTQAGILYVQAAEKVINIQKQLYQDIRDLNNKSHITVGVTSQFALKILSDIIPKFKALFPDVSIEITETNVPNLTKMILEENIDLGIMALNKLSSFDNHCYVLRNEEVYFAIPITHPYNTQSKSTTISIKTLVKLFREDNFLQSKIGSTLRTLSDKIFAEFAFIPKTIMENNSIVMTRDMVSKGVGVTFIGESCATNTSKITYYHLEPKLFRYNVLVWRKNWLLKKAELEFCSYIKNYFPKEE